MDRRSFFEALTASLIVIVFPWGRKPKPEPTRPPRRGPEPRPEPRPKPSPRPEPPIGGPKR